MYDVRRDNPDSDDALRGGGSPGSRGSLLPVMIVLGFGAALIVGLIAATGLAGLYIVIALSGVLAFAGLHYALWGWWLSNRIRNESEQEAHDAEG